MKMFKLILLVALTLPLHSVALLNSAQAESTPQIAKVGQRAPYFALDAFVSTAKGKEFQKISLDDFHDKWVVLFFYPMDFTTVCPTEIKAFNLALPQFKKLNAVVLGASTDSKYTHLAWVQRGDLGPIQYPLLSDIKRETAQAYGVLDENAGVALRGLYIIDPEGVLQYQVVQNLDVGRNVDEILRILQALQTGALCPVGWRPGEKTIKKPDANQ